MRNVDTGQFQLYNIANNEITGSTPLSLVGSEWELGGFAPTASNGFIGNSGGPLASQPAGGSTSQLVQAMAGFDGSSGAGESLNAGGDVLDFQKISLPRSDTARPMRLLDGTIRMIQNGAATDVQINSHPGEHDYITVATLQGVNIIRSCMTISLFDRGS